MVTEINERIFINGEELGYFEEPFDDIGVWNRTIGDALEKEGEQ